MAPKGSPKLTAKKRNALPAQKFGLPGQRKYPLDTPSRARNAKARAAQQVDKSITAGQQQSIDNRADRVLAAMRKQGRR